MQPTSTPPCPPGISDTFWTLCSRCGIRFEYIRPCLNRFLICANCHLSFWAVEVPAPDQSSTIRFTQQPFTNFPASGGRLSATPNIERPMHPLLGSRYWANVHQSSLYTEGGKVMSMPSSAASQAAAGIHQTVESLKTGREEASVNASNKRRPPDEQKLNNEKKVRITQMAAKSGSSSQATVSRNQEVVTGAGRIAVSEKNKRKSLRELSQPDIRKFLIEKTRLAIRKKVNEWNVANTDKDMEKPKATASVAPDSVKYSTKGNNVKKVSVSPSPTNVESKAAEVQVQSMSVPDSDFYDFDKDRVETSFAENQVWAAYDCDDGMPRYYAMVKKVISKRPFKTSISWLNSKSNSELGPMKWVLSGFPKTCGDLWIGKSAINTPLNTFSHEVKWTKGPRGVIQIFPSKGDVWALYRNWSPEWNKHTPDNVVRKYEMVQVLEDFSENQVTRIIPLIKVPGYRSVFKQHSDPNTIRSIPREEIFRLSHQVPSYVLTGEEAPNAPRGFLELDPAALPPELLQVITEAEEAEEGKPGNEVKPDETDTRNETKARQSEDVPSWPVVTYFRRRGGKKAAVTGSEAKTEMPST